jgi:pyruvate dehydrogenase E2 component (dihydrolipoamide acetyltransferase)
MAEVIRMPLLSDTMTEGKIVKWNKKVGDLVKADDSIADVETDKATMDVVGYADGTLLYIGLNEGEAAKVNDIIAIIGKPGEDIQSYLNKETAPAEKPVAAQPAPSSNTAPENSVTPEQLGVTVIRMPLLSDTMTSGKIVQWNKKVGEKVKSDDNLVDVETDKATMEVVGYTDGTLLHVGVKDGESAKVNDIIAIIGKEGTDISGLLASLNNPSSKTTSEPATAHTQTPVQEPQKTVIVEVPVTSNGSDGRLKASPLAKTIAKEKGIDLNQVIGTGDNGRITKKDIDGFNPASSTAAQSMPSRTVVAGKESSYDTQLTSMRKTIARRLGESMFTAPHFYLRMEINMDNAMSFRTQLNAISPTKISFQDILIKACALSLKQHPAVNSSWMGDFIRTYDHVHIGSAIALPEGLIVPVIKFADQKSLPDISAESKELYDKARNKKIQPQDFTGNTFTISNLGMMDIDDFTAIINPPDSCILAVGKIKEIVVKKGDGFATTNVMKLTLSCDHRSVDGAVGAAFLQTLKKYMENPLGMLL